MYILATNFTVPQEGSTTQIIGYGVVEFDKPKEWNQVQKVLWLFFIYQTNKNKNKNENKNKKHSVGTFAYDQEGTGTWMIFYTVDTTGGDSGSAVENNVHFLFWFFLFISLFYFLFFYFYFFKKITKLSWKWIRELLLEFTLMEDVLVLVVERILELLLDFQVFKKVLKTQEEFAVNK